MYNGFEHRKYTLVPAEVIVNLLLDPSEAVILVILLWTSEHGSDRGVPACVRLRKQRQRVCFLETFSP